MPRPILRLTLGSFAFLAGVPLALALITAPTSLQSRMDDAQFIFVGKVEQFFPDKPALVVKVEEDLKGKAPFRQMPINFQGNATAQKEKHVPQLLKRLAPGLPVVVFATRRGKNFPTFVYTNGTWFFLTGRQVGDNVVWGLENGEPYLRKTFRGTTAELRQIVRDVLAGKAKPPALNEKEPPGFGPAVAPKSGWRTGGPLFAVIPTISFGPLAILALLFPTIFGGVLVLFRQWLAFLTVLSVNSTLFLLRWWLGPIFLRGSWWNSDAALWFVMTLVALAGVVWCWRRQLANLALGPRAVETPRTTERRVLLILSAVCLANVLLTWFLAKPERYDLLWNLTLVLSLGVWVGTAYRLSRDIVGTQPALATEGVIVSAVLLGHLGYAGWRWGQDDTLAPVIAEPSRAEAVAGVGVPQLVGVRWQFPVKESGLFVATPWAEGDRVYAAAAHPSFHGGTLFCLDRHTGKELWNFIDDGDLKEMISSPVVADGRIYLGEGFHDSPECKLYCLDAAQGKKLWAFQTKSQTEATPVVADGKVYFGAGNDGIYCLDAADGSRLWQFPEKQGRLLRCGSSPAVVGGRVFAGSGVDRNRPDDPGETAVFCLDAATGQLRWKVPTDLPAWGAPVVAEKLVYFGLGNGDVFDDAPSPAGRLLCVDAETGKEAWHFDVPNGVLDRPALDGHHVYFSCRDGHVYCLDRRAGTLRWKTPLGSPLVGSPALARCPGYAQTAHVFAVATAGKVACLDPHTGAVQWSADLANDGHFSASPRVVVSRTAEGDRRQVFVNGGVGGRTSGRPVVFCLEDQVKVE